MIVRVIIRMVRDIYEESIWLIGDTGEIGIDILKAEKIMGSFKRDVQISGRFCLKKGESIFPV